MTLRELHLFAGIGGGILGGMLLGHRCVGAVEINTYCRSVLEARQRDGLLESFPIHDDIKTFDATAWRGCVDIVCGGFPCQPWSVAGKRKGAADERHLWPEMARVIAECRPRYVFAENVSMAAFAEPWRDLRGLGYRVPPAICLAASDVGAPHIRKRWWLLAADANGDQYEGGSHAERGALAAGLPDMAYTEGIGRGAWRPESAREQGRLGPSGGSASVAHADSAGLEVGRAQRSDSEAQCETAFGGGMGDADRLRQLQPQGGESEQWRRIGDAGWWATEPDVGRVAHGVPARVERLRGLGNAQVPAQAAAAFRELMRLHYAEARA